MAKDGRIGIRLKFRSMSAYALSNPLLWKNIMTRIDGSQSSSQPLSPPIDDLDLAQVPHDPRPVRREHELPPNVLQRCVLNNRPPLRTELRSGGPFDLDQFAIYGIPPNSEPVRRSGSNLSISRDGDGQVRVNLGTFGNRGGNNKGAGDFLICPSE